VENAAEEESTTEYVLIEQHQSKRPFAPPTASANSAMEEDAKVTELKSYYEAVLSNYRDKLTDTQERLSRQRSNSHRLLGEKSVAEGKLTRALKDNYGLKLTNTHLTLTSSAQKKRMQELEEPSDPDGEVDMSFDVNNDEASEVDACDPYSGLDRLEALRMGPTREAPKPAPSRSNTASPVLVVTQRLYQRSPSEKVDAGASDNEVYSPQPKGRHHRRNISYESSIFFARYQPSMTIDDKDSDDDVQSHTFGFREGHDLEVSYSPTLEKVKSEL